MIFSITEGTNGFPFSFFMSKIYSVIKNKSVRYTISHTQLVYFTNQDFLALFIVWPDCTKLGNALKLRKKRLNETNEKNSIIFGFRIKIYTFSIVIISFLSLKFRFFWGKYKKQFEKCFDDFCDFSHYLQNTHNFTFFSDNKGKKFKKIQNCVKDWGKLKVGPNHQSRNSAKFWIDRKNECRIQN